MKIGAIKKACVDTESFILLTNNAGQQWICNGCAAWPVEGFRMSINMIASIFGLNMKQQEKFDIREGAVPDEDSWFLEPTEGEERLTDLGLAYSGGKLYRALKGQDGLLFIDIDWTKPGERKGEEFNFEYRLRKQKQKTPMIACYGDMLVSALVMPMKAEGIMEDLDRIAREPLNSWYGDGEDE